MFSEEVKTLIAQVNDVVPAYLVGGSVRDILLGKEPKDFDFTTPVLPDEVEERIKASGRRAYQIGNSKVHGTIACKIDGQEVQITTFRKETYESGNRRPSVTFVDSLREDLSRRDFTINAMAVDSRLIVHDYFGGMEDLDEGRIRCVGIPGDRIDEDPLRMLRAFRFMSTYEFDIDQSLEQAILARRSSILTISKERWVQELDKLFIGDDAGRALKLMNELHVLRLMFPELREVGWFDFLTVAYIAQLHGVDAAWTQFISGCFNFPIVKNLNHDRIMKQDMARKIAHHLKFSKARLNYLLENV